MAPRPGWYLDESDEESQWTLDNVKAGGFWQQVDSQSLMHGEHRGECRVVELQYRGDAIVCGDWTHVRGTGCLAARADREQCSRPPLDGVPFCDFHFGSAWAAMRAFVNDDREREMGRLVEFDRNRSYAKAQIDLAIVEDARRQMLTSNERVYFFAAATFVKIGRSINPEKRVRTLNGTKAPAGIDVSTGTLLGTIPGGCGTESELHRQFARYRTVGEWFQLEPIRESIAALIAEAEERAA